VRQSSKIPTNKLEAERFLWHVLDHLRINGAMLGNTDALENAKSIIKTTLAFVRRDIRERA
jgi:hypothetical protein